MAALLTAATACTIAIVGAPLAAAHPLGNFTHNTFVGFDVSPDRIAVDHVLDLAEVPTFQERGIMDGDGDGEVSSAEATAWGRDRCESAASSIVATTANGAIAWTVGRPTVTFPPGQGDLPTTRLECTLTAPIAATVTALDARVTVDEGRVGWHEIIASGSGLQLSSDVPATSASRRLTTYPTGTMPPDATSVHLSWASTTAASIPLASLPQATTPAVASAATGDTTAAGTASAPFGIDGAASAFTDLVSRQDVTAGVRPRGAGHRDGARRCACRGARSRQDAYGGISGRHRWTQAGRCDPRRIGDGSAHRRCDRPGTRAVRLHCPRPRACLPLARTHQRAHRRGCRIEPAPPVPERTRPRARPRARACAPACAPAPAPAPTPAPASHPHPHPHPHPHEHPADIGRVAVATAVRIEASNVPDTAARPRPTTRRVVALGLAGGLVPSPSAVVVLLAGVALGRSWFALLLVVAFGLGMAATLCLTGLLVVRVGAVSRRLSAGASMPGVVTTLLGRLPVLAAVGVVLAGLWIVARSLMAM